MKPLSIGNDALAVLMRYGWPGNVRQLSGVLFRADGHLRPLEEIEADIIRLAIGHYRGRMTEVARRLGIGRSTLTENWANSGSTPPPDGVTLARCAGYFPLAPDGVLLVHRDGSAVVVFRLAGSAPDP